MTANDILSFVFAGFVVLLLGMIFINVLGGSRTARRQRHRSRGALSPGITGVAAGNGWHWSSGEGGKTCDDSDGGCGSDGGGGGDGGGGD